MGNMTTLSSQGAANIEKALETIKEKDLKITRMQDALTKKDSVTLALVTSLKSSVGISDPDIEVNVEKGVVFISIADKLLFKSGSYMVSDKAKEVLAKVPSVGASFSRDENMAVAEDLYEAKKEFDRALKTYKKLNETDNKAAEAYRDKYKDLMHNPAGTVKELENIKRRENYVRNLPSREKNPEKGMSAEEKAAELAILKERKDRLAPLVQGLRRKADF
jgi:tetratricopeptide (TPR) repeat protein